VQIKLEEAMATLERVQKKLNRLSPDERGPKEQLITELAEVVVGESSEHLEWVFSAFLDALPPPQKEDDPAIAVHAARAQNAVRILARRERLQNESRSSTEVQQSFGLTRERLRQLRNQGKLLAIVRGERRPSRYPDWQFTPDPKRTTVEGLEDILEAAAGAGIGPETLHFFMTAPNDRLDGDTPADVLQQGGAERVRDILRSTGLGPF
jgi:uncharacterized protein (DUF2384 family)